MLSATVAALALSAAASAGAGPVSNTVTLGATKLFWPAAEIEYERKLTKKLAVSGFLGAGNYKPFLLSRAVDSVPDISMRSAGLRFNTYPFGKFKKGFQLGVTARRMALEYKETQTERYEQGGATATATLEYDFTLTSWTVGPHIGYKRVIGPGFTVGFNAGVGSFSGSLTSELTATANAEGYEVSQSVGSDFSNQLNQLPAMIFGTVHAGWSF